MRGAGVSPRAGERLRRGGEEPLRPGAGQRPRSPGLRAERAQAVRAGEPLEQAEPGHEGADVAARRLGGPFDEGALELDLGEGGGDLAGVLEGEPPKGDPLRDAAAVALEAGAGAEAANGVVGEGEEEGDLGEVVEVAQGVEELRAGEEVVGLVNEERGGVGGEAGGRGAEAGVGVPAREGAELEGEVVEEGAGGPRGAAAKEEGLVVVGGVGEGGAAWPWRTAMPPSPTSRWRSWRSASRRRRRLVVRTVR